MENFNLKIMGTREFIEKAKIDIKELNNEGLTNKEIVEKLFTNFPKDIKEGIIRDLDLYL